MRVTARVVIGLLTIGCGGVEPDKVDRERAPPGDAGVPLSDAGPSDSSPPDAGPSPEPEPGPDAGVGPLPEPNCEDAADAGCAPAPYHPGLLPPEDGWPESGTAMPRF